MSDTFWLVAIILSIGACYRVPAIVRARHDPMVRQVGGLLLAATAVFFFAAPVNIAKVNALTGIPNFSAPWVYSLLVGFSASCLLLIIKWRSGTGQGIRRATWWVYGSYGTLLAGLWLCFSLGDHHVERLRDFDTYYATTPWMREMILLYLAAHTVAVLITSVLLWTWERRVRGTGWLHTGVVMLTVGYAMNLLYDAVKITAVAARWRGGNLDYLSTNVAPAIAAVVGVLIGLGFVVPYMGERVSRRLTARREYWELAPLARLLQPVPAASGVSLDRRAPLQLRLTHRKTLIRDALRHLQPYIEHARHDHDAQPTALESREAQKAKAKAEVIAITAAVARLRAGAEPHLGQASDSLSDPISISRALRKMPSAPAAHQPIPKRA